MKKQSATILSAELSCSYFETGKFLSDPKVKYNELNGLQVITSRKPKPCSKKWICNGIWRRTGSFYINCFSPDLQQLNLLKYPEVGFNVVDF